MAIETNELPNGIAAFIFQTPKSGKIANADAVNNLKSKISKKNSPTFKSNVGDKFFSVQMLSQIISVTFSVPTRLNPSE